MNYKMRSKYVQGRFTPRNPKKYKGDPTNIIFRSSWECRAMMFFDTNSFVLEWASEEFCINYISPKDNRVHRYFPDFLCKMQTKTGIKTYLIEVKPESQIQPPKPRKYVTQKYLNEILTYSINQAKWASAKAYCELRGWEFMTLNEYDLSIKPKPTSSSSSV